MCKHNHYLHHTHTPYYSIKTYKQTIIKRAQIYDTNKDIFTMNIGCDKRRLHVRRKLKRFVGDNTQNVNELGQYSKTNGKE